eukprot:m.40359 g.40359  ORF g.40359 m.40359 type:complete len:94 (-) comp45865_c0_seq1:273-554(-)
MKGRKKNHTQDLIRANLLDEEINTWQATSTRVGQLESVTLAARSPDQSSPTSSLADRALAAGFAAVGSAAAVVGLAQDHYGGARSEAARHSLG